MKKKFILLPLIILAMLFSACSGASVSGGAENGVDYQLDSKAVFNDFLDKHPDRTAFTAKDGEAVGENEEKAADYIYNYFLNLGFAENRVVKQDINVTLSSGMGSSKKYKTRNIKAVYPSKETGVKDIIISCNYDNLYSSTDFVKGTGTEGAFNSGSSVAALLTVAKYLKENSIDLPYNIVFIAFGGGQVGSIGAQAYVNNSDGSGMSKVDIVNTLLMFNIGAVGGGDYAYLYCDELSSPQSRFILDKTAGLKSGIILKETPSYKSTTTMIDSLSGLPYSHIASNENQAIFANEKIKTAHIFGQNMKFNLNVFGNYESSSKPSVSNTALDNRAKLNELYTEEVYLQKINNASSIVLHTITADPQGLITAMAKPAPKYGFFTAEIYLYLARIVLIALCFMLATKWSRALMLKYFKKELVPIIQQQINADVFGKEYGDGKKETTDKNSGKKDDGNPFDGY